MPARIVFGILKARNREASVDIYIKKNRHMPIFRIVAYRKHKQGWGAYAGTT